MFTGKQVKITGLLLISFLIISVIYYYLIQGTISHYIENKYFVSYSDKTIHKANLFLKENNITHQYKIFQNRTEYIDEALICLYSVFFVDMFHVEHIDFNPLLFPGKHLYQYMNHKQYHLSMLQLQFYDFFIIGFFIVFIILVLLIRERDLRANKKKLEKMIEKRTNELEMQKEELQTQIEFTTIQNHKIEKQNKELEKHRINLEQLVQQRTKDLKAAKQRAEESDRLKTSFLANMSHEIRTPMNAIVGFSNIMYDESLTKEEQKELLNHINDSSNYLLKLIENIIDISKIESNELKFKYKLVNLNHLIDEMYTEYKNAKELNNRGICFKIFKPYKKRNIYINTDPWRVKQILSNLIDNAIKFTISGEIEFGYLVVQTKPQKICKFYVKDTGIGLSKEQQQEIFEVFRKVNNDNVPHNQGTGIGLSICKKLVGGLDGELWVESTLGGGSTFYFTIPHKKTNGESQGLLTMPYASSNHNWSDKCLVLVCNNKAESYKDELEETHIHILDTEALASVDEIIGKQENKVDLVLICPDYDLTDVTNTLNELGNKHKELPIIRLTYQESTVQVNRMNNKDYPNIIEQPFYSYTLVETIERFIH